MSGQVLLGEGGVARSERPATAGEAVGYRYDDVGNRTRLIYPHQGKEVEYQYNEANQLVKVIDWDMQETTYQYDVVGRPITITLPNGISTSLSYDDAGNLLSLTHQTITGTIGSYVYEYDNTGRRIGAVEIGRVMTYTYDALYRLTDAIESTGTVYHYAYDAAGNRLLKVEPGVNQAATYDAANQLLTLGGLPVLHDDNGNLVHDGEFTYTYNSLDQLISVSNGITGTLYGYNGDGDRLWQNTDGVTTTFILDLNGALAQVLAQTPHTVNGATTYFVPGANGQQTQGVWSYLHSDGLGSIRHLTDASGQVLGNLRYSPFGELVEMSGPSPMFGFTGEQQGGLNDLVYLRARYYNPALGRFLTPDSLIPDITNGQSLNAYAYVTNDPINLIDPNGNFPIFPTYFPTPSTYKAAARNASLGVLNFLDWYYEEPDSATCSCKDAGSPGFWGPIGGVGAQVAWGIKSQPAARYGNYTLEARYEYQVAKWWRQLPGMHSRFMNWIIPRHWGYKTVLGPWEAVPGYSRTGWIDDIVPRALNDADGIHVLADEQLRYRVASDIKWKNGLKGAAGAALIAGFIDGFTQLVSDWRLCLSRAERTYRIAIAMGLGLIGGMAASLTFTALAGATLTALPVVGALAVGLGFAGIMHRTGAKDRMFDLFPK